MIILSIVNIMKRDALDLEAPTPRGGVPQCRQVSIDNAMLLQFLDWPLFSYQLHGLLSRGCVTVDSLFPGMYEEWRSNGAAELDMVREFQFILNGTISNKIATT